MIKKIRARTYYKKKRGGVFLIRQTKNQGKRLTFIQLHCLCERKSKTKPKIEKIGGKI